MSHLLYLDPGSSSYIIQMIAAGALGAIFFLKNIIKVITVGALGGIFFLKNFWYQIKSFFTGKKDPSEEDKTKP